MAQTSRYEKIPSSPSVSIDLESNGIVSESSSALEHSCFRSNSTSPISPRVISDAILGLSDGMTVPFALTAGLSELGDTRVVVLAGLAELVAGAISMGLGGYLAAKSEEEMYTSAHRKTQTSIRSSPAHLTVSRISSVFSSYISNTNDRSDNNNHLCESLSKSMMSSSPIERISSFLLRFEQDMSEPSDSRAIICAITIASGYFCGGLIPLLPYILVGNRSDVQKALMISIVTMIVTLFVLGAGKALFLGSGGGMDFALVDGDDDDDDNNNNNGPVNDSSRSRWRERKMIYHDIKKATKGGTQMVIIGGISAGCAVGLVKGFNSLL